MGKHEHMEKGIEVICTTLWPATTTLKNREHSTNFYLEFFLVYFDIIIKPTLWKKCISDKWV